jgi:hypothetical protein
VDDRSRRRVHRDSRPHRRRHLVGCVTAGSARRGWRATSLATAAAHDIRRVTIEGCRRCAEAAAFGGRAQAVVMHRGPAFYRFNRTHTGA